MTEQQDQDQLFDEAVDLIIRLQNNPDNPVALDGAQKWCLRSPYHAAAWAEAAEIYGMTGQILNGRQTAKQSSHAVSRRTLLLGGLIGAGILGGYVAPRVMGAKPDYKTTTAEVRHLTLADNSTVTLGPNSGITVEMTDQVRRIGLLDGMAFFDVTHDPARPFEVKSGDTYTKVLGTSFDVSLVDDLTAVSVVHGRVAVHDNALPGRELQITDGEWIKIATGKTTYSRGQRNPDQMAAWRQGLIVAEDEPLSDVVARVSRWHRGRVVLASPSLSRQRISGVFDLSNPLLALEAIVHPYGGKVREISPYLVAIYTF
ncbi:FecR domain-containing protein [Agrobacterium sp. AGB01]|uniref:FecR family protein n=1 Tax=Agrobacterium sp. AGB01 TaxID=2769302 RepID=UPI001780AA62|nr:FecR domain-containing protein [Agrobacterium sp. AGB01]